MRQHLARLLCQPRRLDRINGSPANRHKIKPGMRNGKYIQTSPSRGPRARSPSSQYLATDCGGPPSSDGHRHRATIPSRRRASRHHDRRQQQQHVTRVTAAVRPLRQCGRTSDGWSALACMEKIMSKSNNSSKLGRTTPTPDLGGAATFTVRELRDDELQEVSGGASTPGPDLSWASYATSGQAPTWFAWFLWQ